MDKKGLIITITLLVTGTLIPLRAQELPLWLRFHLGRKLTTPMPTHENEMLFDPSSPFSWEQQQERKKILLSLKREEQARKTLRPVKNHFRKPAVRTSFKLHGGNTQGNWSPFPDRALDARAIRYPMPRSAAYGKGPAKGAPRGGR